MLLFFAVCCLVLMIMYISTVYSHDWDEMQRFLMATIASLVEVYSVSGLVSVGELG